MTQLHQPGVVTRVLNASRALAAAGQQDMIWGHVGIRDLDGRGVWMKRSGVGLDELVEEDIQLINWDGCVIEGIGKAHIESHIHLQIMRARSDVTTSVHTHAPAINAFSALDVPLKALSHEGVLFVAPQVPRTRLSGDLIFDTARGAELAASLGKAPACLMPRHGVVTVGASDAYAVMHAVLLDAACALHLRTSTAGPIASWSDDAEVSAKKKSCWPQTQIEAGYRFLIRTGPTSR